MTDLRDAIKAAAEAAAWDEGQDCPTCHGDGKIPNGRRLIHSFAGGFGADWELPAVLKAIDSATKVGFGAGIMQHDLYVETPDGRTLLFQVPKPDGWSARVE